MTSPWQPHRESIRSTLARNGVVALVLGSVLARWTGGGLARWPSATLVMLWPSLGGHYVDLWFVNWLRPHISGARAVQAAVRIAVWFVGGCVLAVCMVLTANALATFHQWRSPPWWLGGLAFIGLELVAHAVMQLRGRPSFYDGRG